MVRAHDNDDIYHKSDDGEEPGMTSAATASRSTSPHHRHCLPHLYKMHRTQQRRR